MHLTSDIFMPRDEQKLHLERNLGDAMAEIVRHMFPHHTAKHVQSAFDVDFYQARNVVKGSAGGVLITRMLHTRQRKHGDAWAFWMALGTLLIGEEADAYEKREVLKLIAQAENVRSTTEERRRRRAALAARTADALSAEPWAADQRLGNPTG